MRLGVLTSLYPGPTRPYEGIFAERRWLGMARRGHEVRIVHPQPRTPGPLARGRWAEIRGLPMREERGGLPIRRPRYWHLPGRAVGNAARFARVGVRALLDGGDLYGVGGAGAPLDAVVCDYAWPAAAACAALARAGVPAIVSGRGSDVLEVAGEAGLAEPLRRALAHASGWCAVSRDLVERLDELGGRAIGHLVPNGVDAERFAPSDRDAARRALARGGSEPWVLVVGHLIPRKDPGLALAAFAAGAPPDARLVFVGRGPLEDDVRAEAARLGVADRTEVVGERPPEELARWYAASDVLLLTSRREGRPNVVLEALASGRPVLATRAGGTAELLEGLDGMLAEGRDAAELGAALARVLATRHEPATLAARARAFSWDAGLEELEGCIVEARDRGPLASATR